MTIEPILHKKTFQNLTTDELYELLRVRSEVAIRHKSVLIIPDIW